MTLGRLAARNVTIVASSYVGAWLAAFVFTLAQAHYLGPARFGELSLALAYSGFLTILIDFGLGTQLSRMVAQGADDHEGALVTTMVIRAALWTIAVPAVWLATIVLGYPVEIQQAILVLAISVLLVGAGNTMASYLQGREAFLVPSIAGVAQRIAVAVIGVLILMWKPEVGTVAGAFVVGSAAYVGILLIGLRVPLRPRPVIRASAAFVLFRSALPLGAFWIATTLYGNIDLLILDRFAPAENVGWYAAGYRLFYAAMIVPTIVAGIVLFPVLSRLSVASRDELAAVIEKGLTFLTFSGVAAGLLFALFADPIVALLYPAQTFAPTANTLRLLAPAVVIGYANSYIAYTLFALHKERRLLVLAVVFAVLNPLANLIAIPLFRQDGAAATTSLTELGVFLWLLRLMPGDLLRRESLSVAAKLAVAALATTVLVMATRELPLAVALVLAYAMYGAVALALRVITATDLRALLGRARPVSGDTALKPFREEVA